MLKIEIRNMDENIHNENRFEDSLYENILIILIANKDIENFNISTVYWQLPTTMQLKELFLKFLNTDYQKSAEVTNKFFSWFNDKYNNVTDYEEYLKNRQELLNAVAINMQKSTENIEQGSTHIVSSSWLRKYNPLQGILVGNKNKFIKH